jgi:serine/threonine protein kinase
MRIFPNSLKPGDRVSDYEFVGLLGAGGFGITYKAEHIRLQRNFAIKEYFPTSLSMRMPDGLNVAPVGSKAKFDYELGLQRFIDEARTLNYLRHPNVVSVVDCLEENNTAYMVMEFEEGESLNAILGLDGKLSERDTSSVLHPILDGLEAVHEAQFLHRDIKPGNIYVRASGSPILLDFGSARQVLGRRRQMLSATVSSGFAPIEQYETGGQLGEWTDIYGLGAVLYRCVVGSVPIAAPDRQSAVMSNRRDPLILSSELAYEHYSANLLRGIDQALQLGIEQRPANIAAWRMFLPS